ncbi:Tudor/PWWP/MBT superfamily protein [Actinidia rufa]|uniref:Tudor/PWWP/MBT superfamily protein n=1 Tax=Actinidia rufa TaxID=165716 RepID=A0A7J0H2L3_9ERIC|nr:Tudor/PWWP/MBT superfamily protein [Actinidia rufa]
MGGGARGGAVAEIQRAAKGRERHNKRSWMRWLPMLAAQALGVGFCGPGLGFACRRRGFSRVLYRAAMASSSSPERGLQEELKDAGNRLLTTPSSTHELLSLLDIKTILLAMYLDLEKLGTIQGKGGKPSLTDVLPYHYKLLKLEHLLSRVEQAPSKSMRDALRPLMKALTAQNLLRHSEIDVKVSVVSCINEIMRVTAPDAPFDDEPMKEIFELTVMALEKLSLASGRCYTKAVSILGTFATVRSCLVMLDLECDELIVEMFQLFLNATRENLPMFHHSPGLCHMLALF